MSNVKRRAGGTPPPERFLSPQGLRRRPFRSRKSKVSTGSFARPLRTGETIAPLIRSFPDILAGRDFKDFLGIMAKAKAGKKTVLFACGAHVIKVGLAPILIDLMERGWITALALNGAGVIHDFEIAFGGRTSEEVGEEIRTGRFGMARETADFINLAVNEGARNGLGFGEAIAGAMAGAALPHRAQSLLVRAKELGLPVTVHVALGTDIIHFHPSADGAALGKTSLRDFFLFSSQVAGLQGGGVYINAGSAVILPEVFLKAVSFVRNKGGRLDNFSTAVFDFLHHYRPEQNVVRRPLGRGGRGFYFVGSHEILLPLLAAALKSL